MQAPTLSAKATLSQLRLKDGFLAFVLDKVQALSFIPIPDQLLSYVVQKAPCRVILTAPPADDEPEGDAAVTDGSPPS